MMRMINQSDKISFAFLLPLITSKDLLFLTIFNNEALDDERRSGHKFLSPARLSLNLWLKCAIRSFAMRFSNKNERFVIYGDVIASLLCE